MWEAFTKELIGDIFGWTGIFRHCMVGSLLRTLQTCLLASPLGIFTESGFLKATISLLDQAVFEMVWANYQSAAIS